MGADALVRRCYHFGPSGTDGRAGDKALLGGKGANLAEMTAIGMPVPPGFTITTATCAEFQESRELPAGLMDEVREHVARLEQESGKRFGAADEPLLLSVRSGAAASMPGMMDTVLNLGLNQESVAALAAGTGERFAYDCYRRLIHMFGEVVMGVPHDRFERQFDRIKQRLGARDDSEVGAEGLKALCKAYREVYRRRTSSSASRSSPSSRAGTARVRSPIAASTTSKGCSAPP
jgi:pyruvate,orthophosphate dikinase